MSKLTKSDFLMYLDVPMHLWATKNDHVEKEKDEFALHLIDQGYEVEQKAKIYLEQEVLNQREYLKLIWQKTYCDKNYQVKIDALIYNSKNQKYDLYEIKSSTGVDKKNLADVTYQFLVLNELLPINKLYILYLNKDYTRKNELSLRALFVAMDVTEEVYNLKEEIENKRKEAFDIIQKDLFSGIPTCLKPKTCLCPTLCHSDLPDFSIYNIPRLHKSKIEDLKDCNIYAAKDIPDNIVSKLTKKQFDIFCVAKSGKPIMLLEELINELKSLTFPLYFLDYETCNFALPLFDGYSPQQHMVFQYSLHIIENNNAQMIHHEYLELHKKDPAYGLLESLKKHVGPTGSVLVWNKVFEVSRNKEMAKRYPGYAGFLENLNSRVYDLADSIKKGFYVHPGFKGSWSIKNVLPIMVPNLTYEDLDIQKGDIAMKVWWDLVYGDSNKNKDLSRRSLLEYCKRDTLAMVEIWKVLNKLIQDVKS